MKMTYTACFKSYEIKNKFEYSSLRENIIRLFKFYPLDVDCFVLFLTVIHKEDLFNLKIKHRINISV